jgi:hypothetical protein
LGEDRIHVAPDRPPDYTKQAVGAVARLIAARHPFNPREVLDVLRRVGSKSQQGFVGQDSKRSPIAPLGFMLAIKIEGLQNALSSRVQGLGAANLKTRFGVE